GRNAVFVRNCLRPIEREDGASNQQRMGALRRRLRIPLVGRSSNAATRSLPTRSHMKLRPDLEKPWTEVAPPPDLPEIRFDEQGRKIYEPDGAILCEFML